MDGEAVERFAPGEVFAGRYRIVTRLGQGARGDVWRADDLALGTPVAIKVIDPAGADAQRSLVDAIQIARPITHPGACRVFDIGEDDGRLFVSMELVRGESLAALVKRVGRLPSEKVADIGSQVCDVLSAAHAEGILHRGLEPANILINEKGRVHPALAGSARAAADRVSQPVRP